MPGAYRVDVPLKGDMKVVFPSFCPNCLSPSPSEKLKVEKVYQSGMTKMTYSIEAPLCSSCEDRYHPSILVKLVFVSIFLFLGTGLLRAYLEGNFPSAENLLPAILGGLIIGSLVIFPIYVIVFYAIEKIRGYPPVKIEDVSPSSVTFSFTNKQYADMFRQANQTVPEI